MADPFYGEIQAVGFNFAPRDWGLCQGAIIPIAQNQALYAIIGNIYGGDGFNTMGLPHLNGRIPLGNGQGPGLSYYTLGMQTGYNAVALYVTELPTHSHGDIQFGNPQNTGVATSNSVVSNSRQPTFNKTFVNDPTTGNKMGVHAISTTGGGNAHENRQPYLAMNYVMALSGIFPPRN